MRRGWKSCGPLLLALAIALPMPATADPISLPPGAAAYVALAQAEARAGDLDAAHVDALRAVEKLGPDSDADISTVAAALAQSGDLDGALRFVASHPVAWYRLTVLQLVALAAAESGDAEQARTVVDAFVDGYR